jgi:hypothetical protein
MSLNQIEAHFEANSPQMDLGVGFFLFSPEIISATPLIKDPSYLTPSLASKLFKVTRKALPVGLGRCADVDDEDTQCDAGRLDARIRG